MRPEASPSAGAAVSVHSAVAAPVLLQGAREQALMSVKKKNSSNSSHISTKKVGCFTNARGIPAAHPRNGHHVAECNRIQGDNLFNKRQTCAACGSAADLCLRSCPGRCFYTPVLPPRIRVLGVQQGTHHHTCCWWHSRRVRSDSRMRILWRVPVRLCSCHCCQGLPGKGWGWLRSHQHLH